MKEHIIKKRTAILILLLVIASIVPTNSLAENSVLSVVETVMNTITDCSDKQFIQVSSEGYDPTACVLCIDYIEGNYSIVVVDGDTAMLVYHFEREELADCIVKLLLLFDYVEAQLPTDRYLQYDLKLTEDDIFHITKENLDDFLAMLTGTSNSTGAASPKGYNSSIPFENLEFTDFLYEEHSNGNANISGVIKNHNNYTIDGYFHILFYKNNRLVHTELSALPTIPAGGIGVWSDLIYAVDYDRVEYADSNVIRK